MKLSFGQPEQETTRYLRVLPDCRATVALVVDEGVRVKHLSSGEAASLCDLLRRRNVFARHAGGNYYTRLLAQMSDRTVVEILVPGEPDQVVSAVSLRASTVEDLVLVAASLGMTRTAVAKRLQSYDPFAWQAELAIGPRCYQLRARSTRHRGKPGLEVDTAFLKRFVKHRLTDLFRLCTSRTDLGWRVRQALDWLRETVRGQDVHSAVIHLAIALETMFIFSESESLARSLGERVAFLLADDEGTRASIDAAVKRFYDARSGVAHGSRRKLRHLSVALVDGVMRLAVLSLCVIAANTHVWPTPEALRNWFARERWVAPSEIERPLGGGAVRRALSLCRTEQDAK